MPLYMDIHHHVEGLTADAAAQAHQADFALAGKYGVKYLHYWLDLQAGKIFCLIEAPTKDAAIAVHRAAHGLLADELMRSASSFSMEQHD